MIFSKFFKFWVVLFVCIAYRIVLNDFPTLIPFDIPSHITFIVNVIITLCSIYMAAMCLSWLSEDMFSREDSFRLFGEKKIWKIWAYLILPFVCYSVYNWDTPGIIIASLLFYMGFKAMVTNHNKHVDAYHKEEIVRRARQETAEKVTL